MASRQEPAAFRPAAARKTRWVTFTLDAPEAAEVFLAGDFTRWGEQARKMKQRKDGTWCLRTWMPPGEHEYRFIVNGQWSDDPRCGRRRPNPFGSENCIV
ncbi:MAG: isoamylase early set domain-containing protein [Planctomycetes bacterium]|nr:isoamylase early set domain-containing protein [Planctomycetota bacterium]